MRKLTLHKPALDDYVDVEKDLNENYKKIEEWANSSGTELDNKFDDGGVSTDYDTAKKMEDKIKFLATQIEKTPIGTILPFAGGTIPKDYLLCDGREITKNDYSELYDILPFGGYIDEKIFRGLAKNEVPDMTGPTLNGYTITESSVFSATFPGWKAFDSVISGDNGGWASLTGQKEGWVQIQYPNKRALSSFTIKTRTYAPGSKLEKISVYGVTTTSEEELFTENLSRAFTTNEKREFKVNFNKKTYDKFKIKVSAPNDQYCAIDEIELFTVDITQFPNHKQETTKKYLPDLRGQFLRGIKDGRKLLDWESEDIKKHNHKVPLAYPPESSVTNTLKEYTEVREKKTIFQTLMLDDNVNDNVYGRPIAKETYEGNETRPSNIGVNYIIKAKNGINDNSIPAYIESLLNDLNNLKNNLGQHIKDNSISSSKLKTDNDADKIKLANLAEEVIKKLGDSRAIVGKYTGNFPLTSAEKNGVYLVPSTGKFYVCTQAFSDKSLSTPDGNFEELSVYKNLEKLENSNKNFDIKYIENLLNKSTSLKNKLLNGTGGEPTASGIYETSDYIKINNGDKLFFYGTNGNSYQWCHAYELYDKNKRFIKGEFGGVKILPSENSFISIEDEKVEYIKISYTSSINVAMYKFQYSEYVEYGKKNILSTSLSKNVVVHFESLDEEIKKVINSNPVIIDNKVSKLSNLFVETYSYFWMKKESKNLSQDNPIRVIGKINSTELCAKNNLTHEDDLCGIIIQYNDLTCKPHIITGHTNETISIYPPIEKDIKDSIISPLLFDSQHLTKYGYKALMQYINLANPKHCEKNKYIARYCPTDNYLTPPFTKLSGTPEFYQSSRNDYTDWNMQYGKDGVFIIPYNDKTDGEYGIEWTVDTYDNEGYIETFSGTCFIKNHTDLKKFLKDEGYEIHIEVYADNTLIYSKTKNTNIIERFCIDYEKKHKNLKLKIYYKKMRNQIDTLFIGSTTFWINENYPTEIFPKHATISEFFDSWGEFHCDNIKIVENDTPWNKGNTYMDGASAKELRRLLTMKNGYAANIYNTSKSGMTSRWGKAWWNVAVKQHNPNVMITNFNINDFHTTMTPSTFEDIIDPYGNIIVMKNNPLTQTEYNNNIKDLFEMCILNNIQPIFIEGSIGSSLKWTLDMISNLAIKL